jgi:hypothetical protein
MGLANDIKEKYSVVLNESSPRLAIARARRDHYRDAVCGVPAQSYNWLGANSTSGVRPTTRHALRVPRAHEAAVKIVGRFMQELPQSRVMPRQETEAERWRAEAVEKMLAAVYGWSNGLVEFQSGAWHANVLGASVFRLGWDINESRPWFRSVRPENVLVKFATGDGREWDYVCYAAERTSDSVKAKYGVDRLEPDRIEDGSGREFVTVIDYWDKDQHVLTAGGKILNDAMDAGKGQENQYGFIPYLIFRNVGPTEYVWGFSDLEFYEGLAEYYNSLISQHADTIKMYSNPPVFAKQTGHSAADILSIFRDGGVISTNKEKGDLRVVQASGAPPEYQSQDARIRALLDQLTFAPPVGGERTSASALMEMGVGTEALLALKRASWEASQRLLNQRILQIIEKLAVGKVSFKGVLDAGMASRSFIMQLDDSDYPSEDEILEAAEQFGMSYDQGSAEILASARETLKEMNYKRLIDGDYTTRVVWNNRTMKADPQYQLMLLNRFAQGALSLRTFLEDTGTADVEQEIKRIKLENEEMPWLRPQVAALMQKQQQGMQGSPAQEMPQAGPPGTNPNAGPQGATPFDMFATALNGSQDSGRSQGPGVSGMPTGAA